MASSALNYPLLSIPAYYVLSLAPHVFANSYIISHGFKPDNSNPHSASQGQKLSEKLPPNVVAKYERAESCHRNSIENLPLYTAAVFAGLLAERTTATGLIKGPDQGQQVTGLMGFVAAWFAVRSLYTVAYLQIESREKSFIRSGLWAVGTGLCIHQIYRAACVIGG